MDAEDTEFLVEYLQIKYSKAFTYYETVDIHLNVCFLYHQSCVRVIGLELLISGFHLPSVATYGGKRQRVSTKACNRAQLISRSL
jgi:hypothetical protein